MSLSDTSVLYLLVFFALPSFKWALSLLLLLKWLLYLKGIHQWFRISSSFGPYELVQFRISAAGKKFHRFLSSLNYNASITFMSSWSWFVSTPLPRLPVLMPRLKRHEIKRLFFYRANHVLLKNPQLHRFCLMSGRRLMNGMLTTIRGSQLHTLPWTIHPQPVQCTAYPNSLACRTLPHLILTRGC